MGIITQITREMVSSKVRRFIIFLTFNAIIFYILFNINTKDDFLNHLCIYRNITGHKCYNCGMTRAFLSVIHGNFIDAIKYNFNVIFVMSAIVVIYLIFWIKFIIKSKN